MSRPTLLRSPFHLVIIVLTLTNLRPAAQAATTPDEQVIIVPELSQPPALEQFLSMSPSGEIAKRMVKVSGFIQQRPRDGEPSSQKTEVYLGHDASNLYVVFVAFDSEPEKVRGRMARRENVFRDDIIEIMLDTFSDKRRAYAFVANPLGVQWDALWTEGSGFDETFDTLWYSRGKRTPQGYVVRLAIPFKSLRFPSTPEQEWNFILLREIRRGSDEQAFWPRVSSRIEGRLNQAATLKIKQRISPGRNMQLIPYATYRTFRVLENGPVSAPGFTTDGFDPDAGLDAKLVFKDKYALDITANPDFNQVESDQPQITVNQRFEVFFPEKRPFFLENANYFATPLDLVFTRRIAEPQVGARLTGKSGPYAIGALISDDEAAGKRLPPEQAGHGDRAAFGVFRISRDVFSQSNIGFLYTDREFAGSYNRVAAVDGRFKLTQNWTSRWQGVRSWSKSPVGEHHFSDNAFTVQLDRSGRRFFTHYHYRDIGRNFFTETGFVPRTDMRDLHLSNEYQFRPEKNFLISWGPNLFLQRIWDQSGVRLDEIASLAFAFNFTGQTDIEVEHTLIKERLRPADAPGIAEAIDFDRHNWNFEFQTGFVDEFRIEADLDIGTQINFAPTIGELPHIADHLSGEIEFNFLPMTQLRVDNNFLFFQLDDRLTGQNILKNRILRSRWNWQFNRRLSLRLIAQYNTTTVNQELTSLTNRKNFNLDFLLTYLVNPWTALYVGVNSNYQNLDFVESGGRQTLVRTRNHLLNDGRQFFVKYSYLFRL